MLLKSFKKNCMSESEFEVVVHYVGENDRFETFTVNYCERDEEKSNVLKLIELYDKKAILTDVHFNKAKGMISVWCTVK